MESAIPQHLMMERTQPVGLRPDWQPPYPSFVARFAPSVTRVAMTYFRGAVPVGGRAVRDRPNRVGRPHRDFRERGWTQSRRSSQICR